MSAAISAQYEILRPHFEYSGSVRNGTAAVFLQIQKDGPYILTHTFHSFHVPMRTGFSGICIAGIAKAALPG